MHRRALITAVLLVACSSGVSKEPQAPVAGEVVKEEPEAPPPAPAGPGSPVEASVVEAMGACWFEKPYSYMFGPGPGVTVGGKSFGMLQAGIGGILYYGDLNSCFAEQAGTTSKSYSDNAPFGALSGLPLHSDQMDDSKPFGYYNPEIVEWGHSHLIPDQDARIGGVPAQEIYDRVFSRFFRMMTESYLYLVDSGSYEREMSEYLSMATQKNLDGIDYLQARFQGKLPQYGGAWDGTTMTPQMAIGFWLRRGLDGTSDELWTGLGKVMKRFDTSWYASLKTTYRSTDIDW